MSLLLQQPSPVRRPPWGMAASVSVHFVLVALLLLYTAVQPLTVQPEPPQSIEVQLVPPPQQPALTAPAPLSVPETTNAPAAPTATAPVVPPTSPAPVAHAAPGAMTKATQLFAAGILKEPSSAKIRKTLATFADSEKLMQLCNIEGLEQIRRANPKFNPDVLASYAMSDTSVECMTLIANGGAFHTGRNWYAIRLRCTVAPDYSGVDDFEFSIGDPIPRNQWDSHNLPVQYDDQE